MGTEAGLGGEERVSLSDAATFLLDECRMVLPGIQALFGFQLIAVFNQRFADELDESLQHVHFVAITFVAIAIALIMTPAAIHRHIGVHHVSDGFLRVSTRLLLASMGPLALGIALDFYLVTRLLIGHEMALPVSAALLALYVFLWGILPRSDKLRTLLTQGFSAGR